MYRLDETHRPDKRWVWWCVAAIVSAIVAAGGVFGLLQVRAHSHKTPSSKTAANVAKAIAKQTAQGVSTHMLFVGDVMWGRTVQTHAEASGLGYSYITSKLSPADRSNYDAWIANFECPITTKDVPMSLQINSLIFNCRPEYLPNLAKWFTAASQANNHTDNNGGTWGLDQTRTNLQQAGIQNFGTYDMNDVNDICEVIAMPAHTTVSNKKVTIPVALCGYMYVVDQTPTDQQLAVMKQYAKVMPVIAMPHMGVEYLPTAEAAKVSAYHRMIDNGADLVVGAHPHVIQNSESYKGKLIVYSEGNFLFDQQSVGRPETLGLGLGVNLTIGAAYAKQIAAYEKIAPDCKVYKDDCLSELQKVITKRPEIAVQYTFTCYDEASGLPQLGDQAACDQARQMAAFDSLGKSPQLPLSPDW